MAVDQEKMAVALAQAQADFRAQQDHSYRNCMTMLDFLITELYYLGKYELNTNYCFYTEKVKGHEQQWQQPFRIVKPPKQEKVVVLWLDQK